MYNSHDNTEKVLLYKSSEDHGVSWSDTKYLTPPGSFWGIASYVVVDSVTDSEHINVIFVYSKVKLFELYSKQELTTLFNISKEDYSEVQTSILYRLSSSDNGERKFHVIYVIKPGIWAAGSIGNALLGETKSNKLLSIIEIEYYF